MLPKRWLVDPSPPTLFTALAAVAVVGGFISVNLSGGADERDDESERPCCKSSRCCGTMAVPLLESRPTEEIMAESTSEDTLSAVLALSACKDADEAPTDNSSTEPTEDRIR
mmetsp:Transcript_79300/g.157679  ORF Transcript_79300/g.157679 Transcript_79300/m.157679 type:complete len:112 (-) Transcript_79300:278-613(-)